MAEANLCGELGDGLRTLTDRKKGMEYVSSIKMNHKTQFGAILFRFQHRSGWEFFNEI